MGDIRRFAAGYGIWSHRDLGMGEIGLSGRMGMIVAIFERKQKFSKFIADMGGVIWQYRSITTELTLRPGDRGTKNHD